MMVILIGRMQQETLLIMKKLSFIDKLLLCLQPKRDASVVIIYKVTIDKENNRKYFLRSLSSIKYLALPRSSTKRRWG